MSVSKQLVLACLLPLVLVACQTSQTKDTSVKSRQFQVEDLAKSDVDMVAEVQLSLIMESLEQLAIKLYKRNPRELRKQGDVTLEEFVSGIFADSSEAALQTAQGKRSVEAIKLAFADTYAGDRVFAFIVGLRGMILDAYNGKQSFYLLDELDPQKLYNAARNIEIAVWRLSNTRNTEGQLLLVSNATEGKVKNLSFERLFGKTIALQDSMARIVAETTNRRIKNVIQSMASAVFLPI